METKHLKTDILVIGGGMAGCFAANTALEAGAKVILAEKNYCGRTGNSNFARDMMLYREEWGDKLEDWKEQFVNIGEYVVNQDWMYILLTESYDRFRDLVRWGVPFYLKRGYEGMPGSDREDGMAVMSDQIGFPEPGEEPFRYQNQKSKYRKASAIVKFGTFDKMMIMRKKAEELGAEIIDRVQMTDLIKKDGKVIGAAGFHTYTGDFYVIEAKAVIVASGGLVFRTASFGKQQNAGEGHYMTYQAGAELINMEFGDIMWVSRDCDSVTIDGPVAELGLTHDSFTNGYGEEFLDSHPHLPTNIHWPQEFHAGNGPLYHEPYGYDRTKFVKEIEKYEETAEGPWITMMDRAKIDIFNDKFPQYMAFVGNRYAGGTKVNLKCETSVEGLYAAGDASGNCFTGPTYGTLGSGMCNAACTGYRSGKYAAEYVKDAAELSVDEKEIEELREAVVGPLFRKAGFNTDHVLLRVQQTIMPYEVREIMEEERLQAALTMFKFFKKHFLPKMYAVDPHDLRRYHEIKSMIIGGEMMLRAAIMRKESRGAFFREDYPRRDDDNWLKWIILKKNEIGEMDLTTEDVPEEWQGDRSEPYEKRYVLQYHHVEEE